MKRLFALLLIFCLLLAGCGVTEPQIEQTQPSDAEQPSDSEQPSQSTGSTENSAPEPEPFHYQVYEERGFNLELQEENKEDWYSTFCVIRSVEELKDQVGKTLTPGETLPEWIEEYDDTFFETNTLLNFSLSVHYLDQVVFKEIIQDETGRLIITVEDYTIPDPIKDQLNREWYYLVEVNRVIEDPKTVALKMDVCNLNREEWKEKFGFEYDSRR